jgi:3,4-dehydroadipyl-CoA semialdehyde dehydrogenase
MGIVSIESFLRGEWRAGAGEGSTLVNPATEEVIGSASTRGLDLGGALAFQREMGGPNLRAMSFAARGEMLLELSRALHADREPLLASAIENGGCTRSDAKFDVDGAIAVLAAYAEVGKALGDRRILPDGDGIQLGRSPRFWGQHVHVSKSGVAVLINAFNFPAWGFAEKAACAWLAGMPVMIKPATSTSLTAYLATRTLVESGKLPEGAIGFVGGSAGDLLDHIEGQDLVAFTGSADTGAGIRRHPRVVEWSVPINIEADSLNAAVLGPDAERGSETWQLFIKEVSREITQKTGQKCTAVRRIMVPESMVDAVAEDMAERFREISIGNPADESVRMGPLATKQQLDDAKAGTVLLRSEADPIYGDPERPVDAIGVDPGRGYFFPIVLLRAKNPAEAKHVHRREVFGPIATLLPYSGGAKEAAHFVRLGGGGLVASVYSDDKRFVEEAVMGIAAHHGRIYLASAKVAEHVSGSGLVLPQCVHGGPGRAGGGEELGGERGVKRFMHRTAVQGARPVVEALTGTKPA